MKCPIDDYDIPQSLIEQAQRSGHSYVICPSCRHEISIQILLDDDFGNEFRDGIRSLKEQSWANAQTKLGGAVSKKALAGSDFVYAQAKYCKMFADKFIIPLNASKDIDFTLHEPYSLFICNRKKSAKSVTRMICDLKNEFFKNEIIGSDVAALDNVAQRVEYMDGIYADLAETKKFYNVVIVYEDDIEDLNSTRADYVNGKDWAYRIAKTLERCGMRNVYIPDKTKFLDGGKFDVDAYEANLLYATENSNCMFVLYDDSPDQRINRLITRFFNDKMASVSRIAYIRFDGERDDVALPGSKFGEAFLPEDGLDYANFARKANGKNMISSIPKEEEAAQVMEMLYVPPVLYRSSRNYSFGAYPQSLCTDERIKDYFRQLGFPSRDDSNGWTIMCRKSNGKPYTWYRDEVINGRKYRAVYFTIYRAEYENQDVRMAAPRYGQQIAGFSPNTLYCFGFDPIPWRVVDADAEGQTVTLSSKYGLDSRSYNTELKQCEWQDSSLSEWLNDDFKNAAFDDAEQEMIRHFGNEYVTLLDKGNEKEYDVCELYNNVPGTDYMRCVGGLCGDTRADKIVSGYWVINDDMSSDETYASIAIPRSHVNGALASAQKTQTNIAVVPKITVIDSGEDGEISDDETA